MQYVRPVSESIAHALRLRYADCAILGVFDRFPGAKIVAGHLGEK